MYTQVQTFLWNYADDDLIIKHDSLNESMAIKASLPLIIPT